MDSVRKELYKQARKQGKTKTDAMLEAGYTKSTAEQAQGRLTTVILGDAEILAEARARVTVDYVLAKLLHEAETAEKSSDRREAVVALGNYLKMFKGDEQKQNIAIYNQYKGLQEGLPITETEPKKQQKDSGDGAGQAVSA